LESVFSWFGRLGAQPGSRDAATLVWQVPIASGIDTVLFERAGAKLQISWHLKGAPEANAVVRSIWSSTDGSRERPSMD
jgi:hypothetical protein